MLRMLQLGAFAKIRRMLDTFVSRQRHFPSPVGAIRDKTKKVNQSHYRPEVPGGFQEVKVPRLRNNGPEWW